MATYIELFNLAGASALRNRVAVAYTIAAEAVRTEDEGTANHANRILWAKGVFENPGTEAGRMLAAILAQNKDLTVAQIQGVTDAALQTAVNNAVNVFATGS